MGRTCQTCGGPLLAHQKQFCSKPCFGISKRGTVKPGQEATEHPTTWDIAWAAGIFEGEGYCHLPQHRHYRRYYPARVQITQKDLWMLERLRALFGGALSTKPSERTGCSVWYCNGARAMGFLMTTYRFLSPRRQAQVRYVLAGVPAAQIPPV